MTALPRAPFSSHETRWFLEGGVERHTGLRNWFETTRAFPTAGKVGRPEWRGRLDDEPDVYLLLPGATDMGIKWREGALQIKGRLASLGTQRFADRCEGQVERWVKWSYPTLPEPYRRLFLGSGGAGLVTIAVRKTRALRKIRLHTVTGDAEEVAADALVDRAVAIELTDLSCLNRSYCSLAFEAFPSDTAMDAAFGPAIATFLADRNNLDLRAADSLGYPAWLWARVSA